MCLFTPLSIAFLHSAFTPLASLTDISGRKVMDLRPGPNDIRHIAPGVYFVAPSPQSSPTRGEEATIRKVVIQR
jgi:hypothetical protein